MNLQDNNCACHPEAYREVLFETKDYNFNTTNASGLIFSCKECGSLYPDKFPTDKCLEQVYVNYYTSGKKRSKLRKVFRWLLRKSQKTTTFRNTPLDACAICDYGCGSGEYLQTLNNSDHNGKLFGYDPVRPESEDGFPFQWLPVKVFDGKGNQFDWLTMCHVLEHVSNPKQIVTRLTSCLMEGGAIWIATPNANSFLIDCFKGWARDVDFPRHRQVFSGSGLHELLSSCGLEIEIQREDRINSVINFGSCAKNLLGDTSVSSWLRLRILSKALWRLIKHMFLPRHLSDLEATELVVICRKST